MTTEPDRQNGDGLPFAQPPVTELHRQSASMFLCWPVNAVDLCKEDRDLPAAVEKLAAFIAVWEAKGAEKLIRSPARDAAEGAGDFKSCGDSDVEGKSNQGTDFTTPPKPAPDAMRALLDAVKPRGLWEEGCAYLEGDNDWIESNKETVIKFLEYASSAPVPTGDGAIMEATPAQHVGCQKGKPAQFVRNGKLETCRCSDCRALPLSPSGTGAAEPVAWPDHPGATVDAVALVEGVKRYPNVDRDAPDLAHADRQAACQGAFINGFKRAMEMRAPPVRGDRALIAAGLVVPVQPGAGEREAVIEECAKIADAVSEEYFALAQTLSHQRGEGNARAASDAADIIADKIRSRQAPHSSSEGGR